MKKNYRLNKETQGTVAGVSQRTIVGIPACDAIMLVGPVVEKPELVEVLWEGQSVWLFATDFNARAIEDGTVLPLTSAASVDDDMPEVGMNAEVNNSSTPKIRRFNAAGRELF